MVTLKPTESGTLEMKQYHDISGQPNPDMFRNTLAILIVRQYSNNIDMLSPQKRETFFTMKLFRH